MKLPKLIITDIDGVWTDGGMYYDQHDNELKKFNTSDSAGVLFCKILKIPVCIITGENTSIVEKRAKKLNIDYLFQGVKNKYSVASQLTEKLQISLDDVAYIGDDLNDVKLLKSVGFSACPANAPEYVSANCKVKLKVCGGNGAFRDFVEHILRECNLLDSVIEEVIATYNNSI